MHYVDLKSLSEVLREYRGVHNKTLRELSDQIGLSYSYLAKIERNEIRPPKETAIKIIESLNLPTYRTLINTGYVVDLESDIRTVDLKLTFDELQKTLKTHRIYATIHLKYKVNDLFPDKKLFAQKVGVSYNELSDILFLGQISLESAAVICCVLNVKFSEVFQIKKVHEIKFIGMRNDEDVALQVHKYIEEYKKNYYTSGIKEIIESLEHSDIPLNQEISKLINSIVSVDEVHYLQECLKLYRNLNLKPQD